MRSSRPRAPTPVTLDFLAAGERVVVEARAKLHPPSRSGLNSFTIVHLVHWIAYRASYAQRMAQYVAELRAAGFPFAERMVLVVTDGRLVVLAAVGRAHRRGPVIGAIPWDDIRGARWPFIGGGAWRTLRLDLRSGAGASLLISPDDGNRLIEVLGTEPAGGRTT